MLKYCIKVYSDSNEYFPVSFVIPKDENFYEIIDEMRCKGSVKVFQLDEDEKSM